MKKVEIEVTINKQIKKEFKAILKDLRIPVDTAFNILIHSIENYYGIPFELCADVLVLYKTHKGKDSVLKAYVDPVSYVNTVDIVRGIGLSMDSVFIGFINAVVRKEGIPFKIMADLPSDYKLLCSDNSEMPEEECSPVLLDDGNSGSHEDNEADLNGLFNNFLRCAGKLPPEDIEGQNTQLAPAVDKDSPASHLNDGDADCVEIDLAVDACSLKCSEADFPAVF